MNKNHPYIANPQYTFWERAISEKAVGEIDPSEGSSSFKIDLEDEVMTLGSCFAQHVSQRLSKEGFKFLVTEYHPSDNSLNFENGYGIFTARYGNIYTITQANELLRRCLSTDIAGDIWSYKGRVVDSHRPRAIPSGYESKNSLLEDRTIHLQATLNGLRRAKILVFTLGLTEGWKNVETGQIYPIAPGVAGGSYDSSIHEPFNMSVSQCISELDDFCSLTRRINPDIKIILTVSPVPLAATHSGKHVLTATFSSKSKLRVAAEMISESNDFVDYFPSFEIIQGLSQSGQYFAHDMREVASKGVDHVMRIFFSRYMDENSILNYKAELELSDQDNQNQKIVCDEDIFLGMEIR
jgi:GSCFA family